MLLRIASCSHVTSASALLPVVHVVVDELLAMQVLLRDCPRNVVVDGSTVLSCNVVLFRKFGIFLQLAHS